MLKYIKESYFSRSSIELFTVYFGIFCAAFVFTVVFPFANDMVMTFGVVQDRNETGYWVGLIATSLMIGRVISSPIWGCIMDSWGRRPVTLFALISMSILSTTFGLSTNLVFSLIIRLILGLLSPLLVSSKTIIAELCKGEQVSSSMAWIVIAWNVGSISGSFFGGILANPVKKGWIDMEFFRVFPFFLSNFMPAVLCVFALVLSYFYLRETLVKVERGGAKKYNRSILDMICDRKVFPIVIVYGIVSYNFTAFQELITLFSWAKKSAGGLELSVESIGYLLGGTNFTILFVQKPFYMYIVHNYGNYNIAAFGLISMAINISLMPYVSIIQNSYIAYGVLFFLCIIFYMLDFMISTSVLVMINNSVPHHELGRINGTTMSLNSLVRALAPTSIGLLFALTINSGLPLHFNVTTSFFYLSSLALVADFFAFKICKSIENGCEDISKEIALVDITEDKET
ncbi:hypothetical protein SteCoe_11331 [Stentor coeruleus]|uniref:Major facilitator superfamily (MFS) profile domain-containing protein n=1 Tax=Stentor coeruleus TaxID=5963 RepID=A0A1R2CDF1_9CILI|nr:hypothetical protein SteCoe_11331 [Stentor coeruleus]